MTAITTARPDATDVDDDNDGLIEIATAQELHNMRHNFAGTSYDDEAADTDSGDTGDTTGGPTSPTEYCATQRGGVYLCGYELVADIDFAGPDGYPAGHDDDTDDNIDLNGNADGNFMPIGTATTSGTRPAFTGRFHGNGHAISHLDIQHHYTASGNSDSSTTAVGFFTFCQHTIRDIFFVNPSISASHQDGATHGVAYISIGVICGESENATLRNVHVRNAVLSMSANRTNSMGALVGETIGGSDSINSVQYSSSLGHSMITNIGAGTDTNRLGGLIGNINGVAQIIHSRSDGVLTVANGTQEESVTGGLVGARDTARSLEIAASHASGSIHSQSSADQADYMGGLLGIHSSSNPSKYFRLRDSLSTVQICDGALSGSTCSAGAGNDRIGALIGQYLTTAESIVQNNLAIGLTEGLTSSNGDAVGFIGRMPNNVDGGATAAEVTTALNAAFVGNYYDSAVTTLGSRVGQLPTVDSTAVMDSDLTGIRPRTTTQLQVAAPSTGDDAPATSVYHGWDTNRWYFKANAYPEPRYYDYEWDHDGDSGTAAISIDICEEITPTNDPELDQGDPLKPDCGDRLSAFPRE